MEHHNLPTNSRISIQNLLTTDFPEFYLFPLGSKQSISSEVYWSPQCILQVMAQATMPVANKGETHSRDDTRKAITVAGVF
jgi:hypothetical protein